ncbi:MAG TPA: AraC family transcriptional regulator [Clostridia bacterium]|jgi:AraC-like DNA-binding protein|nr:helix-turn-helix transcriptional regulator [Clostridia bacterium]NLV34198.1 helix-turn-helix transcriptional regulator [Clostridiaceae bacterium]HPB16865.1 AraC family transcriptional regulator [Clostridia bacterium]HQM96318.1 AraC family transcriptional regulator [Clostridia bacterium]HQO69354.1 AraC family transcriptional regulator [Clostridia bacterium]
MTEKEQNNVNSSFYPICENTELLSKMMEFFIFPVLYLSLEGTLLYANKTFLLKYNLENIDSIKVNFNIFNDPEIKQKDKRGVILKAFKGETVFLSDVDIDIDEIIKSYGACGVNACNTYMDIVLFPIKSECNRMIGVAVLLACNNKEENEVIINAKKYIKQNYMNKYVIGEASDYLHFSKSYFIKLFKNSTNITPHEFLMSYKLELVKEKLISSGMTVKQAFCESNLVYNGHMADEFRKKYGRLPLSYKKSVIKGE